MDDLRLKTADITVGGRTYTICCNMNVLADVQNMYDGDMRKALADSSANGIRNFLAAMINDARDNLGEEPLSIKEVGRLVGFKNAKETILPLIIAAFADSKEEDSRKKKTTATQRG